MNKLRWILAWLVQLGGPRPAFWPTMHVLAPIAMPLGALATLADDLRMPAGQPDEIVFAVRQPGVGSHWQEKFGYYAQDEHAKAYRALGQLCQLNVNTGQLTILRDTRWI
jgi:hypothetical protein